MDVSKEFISVSKKIVYFQKGWCLYFSIVVIWEGQRIVGGGEEIPLSAVRPCGMKVPPNLALNMSESLYLIIGYLLRDEHRRLGVIVL